MKACGTETVGLPALFINHAMGNIFASDEKRGCENCRLGYSVFTR